MRARTLLRRLRCDRGTAVVETALVFPLLLVVVLGLIEVGFLMYSYNTVKHSAMVGLRKASVERTLLRDSVVRVVKTSAYGLKLDDSAIQVLVNGGNKLFSARAYGDSLEVRVSYSYRPVLSRVIPNLDVPIDASARGVVW